MNEKWPEIDATTFIQDYREIYRAALGEFNDSVGGWIGGALSGVREINQAVGEFMGGLNSIIDLPEAIEKMNRFLSLNDQFINTICANLRSDYPSASLDFFKEIGHQLRKGALSSQQIGDSYLTQLKVAGGDNAATYYQALQNDNINMWQKICPDLESSCLDTTLFCTTKNICSEPPLPAPAPQSQGFSQPQPITVPANNTNPASSPTPASVNVSSGFDIYDIWTSAVQGAANGLVRGAISHLVSIDRFSPQYPEKIRQSLFLLTKALVYCGYDFSVQVLHDFYQHPEDPDRFVHALLSAAIKTGQVALIVLAVEVSEALFTHLKKSFNSAEDPGSPSRIRQVCDAIPTNVIAGMTKCGFFALAAVIVGPGKTVLGRVTGFAAGIGTQLGVETGIGALQERYKLFNAPAPKEKSSQEELVVLNQDQGGIDEENPNLPREEISFQGNEHNPRL